MIHSTPTQNLSPRYTQTSVEIPTSTVVSIGLGFVAFALGCVCILLLIRVLRIHRSIRAARRRGQQTSFLETWRDEGGIWGFFTGLGGEAIGGGGGMHLDLGRMRRMEELLRRMEESGMEGSGVLRKKPELWEVEIEQGGGSRHGSESESDSGVGEKMGFADLMPLEVSASDPLSTWKSNPDSSSLPELSMSVLILFPTDHTKPTRTSLLNDEYHESEELPDLVIGSTSYIPILARDSPTRGDGENGVREDGNENENEEEKRVGDVDDNEEVFDENQVVIPSLGHSAVRRAGWVKEKDGRWTVEGLK